MAVITCHRCGKENRREAKFCQHCGADFSPTRQMVAAAPAGTKLIPQALQPASATRSPTRPPPSEPPATPQLSSSPQPGASPATTWAGLLVPLERGSVLLHPRDSRQRYAIVTARQLARSIYYDALDLVCPSCGSLQPDNPPGGQCLQCGTALRPVLIHERRPRPTQSLDSGNIEKLIRLSVGHPGILPHQAIMQYPESTYTVVEHPGRWRVLVRGRRQYSPDEALAGVVQVGRTLNYLHGNGFVHSEVGGASIESLVVTSDDSIKLADLSSCVRLQSDRAQAVRAQMDSDVAFLAWLLFFLATGKELSRGGIEMAPSTIRPFIERAMQKQYASVQDMLTDFEVSPPPPAKARSLKPAHGQATHPGRRRTRNEDAVVTFTFHKEQDGGAVPIGFYLVADGMGGHEAGDVASRTVNCVVTDWIIKTKVLPDLQKTTRKLSAKDTPGELLTQAIRQANQVLLERGRDKPSNMGSTVTAALIIGDVATIANVGDSRTYLLREGRLEQITQDHSLVARLVDAGVIRPEEVRNHPQRGQIYRCLGHKPDVEVDTFMRQLQAGDALILCSDGLWEMVSDAEIQRIVTQAHSPQQACDALIEAANQAGGEDNVTVIVVEVE